MDLDRDNVGFYTMSHPEYFETLSRLPLQPTYFEELRACLPVEWSIFRFDIWLQAKGETSSSRSEGFKIHLSCCLPAAKAMIRRFVPVCTEAKVEFKIVADPMLHGYLNSKRYYRGGSGKFATIYPPDHASFLELIEALHQATKDLEGPYILSDKRYRCSNVVFYRWGGFKRIPDLRPDGARRQMVHSPDGGFVPDERLPYFKLPEWVIDPFPDEKANSPIMMYDVCKLSVNA